MSTRQLHIADRSKYGSGAGFCSIASFSVLSLLDFYMKNDVSL